MKKKYQKIEKKYKLLPKIKRKSRNFLRKRLETKFYHLNKKMLIFFKKTQI